MPQEMIVLNSGIRLGLLAGVINDHHHGCFRDGQRFLATTDQYVFWQDRLGGPIETWSLGTYEAAQAYFAAKAREMFPEQVGGTRRR